MFANKPHYYLHFTRMGGSGEIDRVKFSQIESISHFLHFILHMRPHRCRLFIPK
jgi:hypothetical protein